MSYFCSECNRALEGEEIKVIDDGIGSYEFWGAYYNDTRLIAVSECCEADVYSDQRASDPLVAHPTSYDGYVLYNSVAVRILDTDPSNRTIWKQIPVWYAYSLPSQVPYKGPCVPYPLEEEWLYDTENLVTLSDIAGDEPDCDLFDDDSYNEIDTTIIITTITPEGKD